MATRVTRRSHEEIRNFKTEERSLKELRKASSKIAFYIRQESKRLNEQGYGLSVNESLKDLSENEIIKTTSEGTLTTDLKELRKVQKHETKEEAINREKGQLKRFIKDYQRFSRAGQRTSKEIRQWTRGRNEATGYDFNYKQWNEITKIYNEDRERWQSLGSPEVKVFGSINEYLEAGYAEGKSFEAIKSELISKLRNQDYDIAYGRIIWNY